MTFNDTCGVRQQLSGLAAHARADLAQGVWWEAVIDC